MTRIKIASSITLLLHLSNLLLTKINLKIFPEITNNVIIHSIISYEHKIISYKGELY